MIERYGIVMALFVTTCSTVRAADGPLGLFTDQSDVGKPSTAGAGSADSTRPRACTPSPAAAEHLAAARRLPLCLEKNSGRKRYHAWRPPSSLPPATAGADPHRKAFLMIRQSLDPESTAMPMPACTATA